MGCCIALAVLLSGVRRLVPGKRGRDLPFAPVARRPEPGSGYVGPALLPTRKATLAPMLGPALITAGLAWFALGLVGMHLLGWFTWATSSVLLDVLFHFSGLWVAAFGAALVLAHRPTSREVTA